MNGREAARSGDWAQHFSNASCSYCVNVRSVFVNPAFGCNILHGGHGRMRLNGIAQSCVRQDLTMN